MNPRHPFACAPILVLALVAAAAATAADRDPTAFEIMALAGEAYVNDPTDCPGLIGADELLADLDDWTVVDIRSQSDYDAGHIPGARHSSLFTLLADLDAWNLPLDEPIAVACHTGQSSGVAKVALELLGYENARTLRWGMASWHSSLTGPWDANVGDALADPEVANQNGNLVTHPFPDLSSYDPATVVGERVAAVLATGHAAVSYQQIEADLDDYFIINYFGVADYEGQGTMGVPGHVPGAFQFTPYASLGLDQMLANIPPDRFVVVYGWTGQHSAQLVAYLRMLGYSAYSLNFGANALFYSSLLGHRWIPGSTPDYPLETGTTGAPADPPSPLGLICSPNPFNPQTTISIDLPQDGPVRVRVYDITGQAVADLMDGEQGGGPVHVVWDGRNDLGEPVPSGPYFVRVDTEGASEVFKLTMVK